jgi:hypothetical protein
MKNIIKKITLTILLLALVSACAVNQNNTIAPDSQENPVEIGEGFQANAILNKQYVLTIKAGEIFEGNAMMAFEKALEDGKQQFTVDGVVYHQEPVGEGAYRIYRLTPIAESLLGGIQPMEGVVLSDELIAAIQKALAENTLTFENQGTAYVLSEERKAVQISTVSDVAVASHYYLEAYDSANNEIINSFNFALNLNQALEKGSSTFTYEQESYGILPVAGGYNINDADSNLFAEFSNIYVIPRGNGIPTLPLGFKNLVRDAIENEKTNFTYTDSEGKATEYQVDELENSWSINPK